MSQTASCAPCPSAAPPARILPAGDDADPGRGGSEAEQVQARVLRLQQRLDAVTGQLAQAKRLTATLPLALQALELRLE